MESNPVVPIAKSENGTHAARFDQAVEPAEPLRIGLVGCGRIAQTHIEALTGFESAALECIVEPREAVGQAACEQTGSLLFRDYADPAILAAVDAVVVCSPPSTHYEIASYYLEHGKHVLCEKPLTIHSEQAQALVQQAKMARRTLMMASKFRYVDDVIKAKAIIESGILGDIVLYENSFCAKVDMHGRWNADPAIAGGGVLVDNGSHAVDIARYLLGPIAEVQAQVGMRAQGLGVEDTIHVCFRTESGVTGNIDLSWSINKESAHYVGVFGKQGTLLVGWKGSTYRQDGNSNWVSFGRGYDKLEAFRRQLRNFAEASRKEAMPLITPTDALASVRVVEATYVSAQQSHWVRI